MLLFNDDTQTNILTIRDCDKKSIEEIQKEINTRIELLNEGKDKDFNKRLFIFKWMPSL